MAQRSGNRGVLFDGITSQDKKISCLKYSSEECNRNISIPFIYQNNMFIPYNVYFFCSDPSIMFSYFHVLLRHTMKSLLKLIKEKINVLKKYLNNSCRGISDKRVLNHFYINLELNLFLLNKSLNKKCNLRSFNSLQVNLLKKYFNLYFCKK